MKLELTAPDNPFRIDETGVVRVGRTRVTLQTLIDGFHDGLTAEELADRFPVLSLAQVYAAIGYFLDHREAFEAYLAEMTARGAKAQDEADRRNPPGALRARLMARMAARNGAG